MSTLSFLGNVNIAIGIVQAQYPGAELLSVGTYDLSGNSVYDPAQFNTIL